MALDPGIVRVGAETRPNFTMNGVSGHITRMTFTVDGHGPFFQDFAGVDFTTEKVEAQLNAFAKTLRHVPAAKHPA